MLSHVQDRNGRGGHARPALHHGESRHGALFLAATSLTGAAAILVLLGAGLTIRQRYRADRKDQWWKRTQWAFDLLLTDEEDREVLGLLVLAQQAAAKAADTEDGAFIAEVVQPVVDAYMQTDDTEVVPTISRAGSASTGTEEERPT